MARPRNFTRKPRSRAPIVAAALLVGAIAGGAVLSNGRSTTAGAAQQGRYTDTVTDCRVVDGDTLNCDGSRIRLLGIDAPELPGHCADGRNCAPGDPYQSASSLRDGMGDGTKLRISIAGADRYGRTLALVYGKGGDLSCWQLVHGAAIYKPRWDNDGRVSRTCPSAAR